jgi:hypothetical protein
MKWFDFRSFLIGLVVGLIAVAQWFKYRDKLKQVKKAVFEKSTVAAKKDITGVDQLLRTEIFYQTQRHHLAHTLFPLDDIYVNQELLAYPFSDADDIGDPPIIDQMIPYLTDASVLSGAFDLRGVNPLCLLQSANHMVVIGDLGIGKTTLFSHLSQRIIQNKTGITKFNGCLPCYVHVSELTLDKVPPKQIEQAFFHHLILSFPKLIRKKILRVLTNYLRNNQIVLLVDGLDEVPPDIFDPIVEYLRLFSKNFPRIKILINASPHYLGRLPVYGFLPMVMKGWDQRKKQALIQKWCAAWQKSSQFEDEFNQKNLSTLLAIWTEKDHRTLTPYEWTLRIWSLFSGDSLGTSPISDIEAYFRRITDERISHKAVEAIANTFLHQQKIALPQSALEMELLKNQFRFASSTSPSQVLEKMDEGAARRRKGSGGTSILTDLVYIGLLELSNDGLYRFIHPIFLAYFGGYQLAKQEPDLTFIKKWTPAALAFGYAASFQNTTPWIDQIVQTDIKSKSDFGNILMASRWLKHTPRTHEWRNKLIKRILTELQKESVPLPHQFRYLAALIEMEDPTINQIFTRLLSTKSGQLRQIAALGLGALRDSSASQALIDHLNDPSDMVAYAAMVSLSYSQQAETPQLLYDYLTQSADEAFRRTAAETLARIKPTGQEILKNLARSEDLITRRAVVFGLAAIHEGWSKELLEYIALNDKEWIVRTTAEHVLAVTADLGVSVPRSYTPYLKAEWLLKYAASQGEGLSPDVYPVELLLTALRTDDSDLQWNALNYLRFVREPEVLREVERVFLSPRSSIGTVTNADYCLWITNAMERE